MRHIDDELETLFRVAFPDLGDFPVAEATTGSVASWDSVMTLTLIALAEEAFGVWIGYDRLGQLTSYQAFRKLLIENLAESRALAMPA